MAIRLIAMDVDGTLLDNRHELPDANRDAILEAHSRGIEIVLVTGRRFDFARPIAERIPCELALIINNGALIKTKSGETHLRHLLPRSIAREVLRATHEFRSGAAVVFDRPRENQLIFESIDWTDAVSSGYYQRNREFIAECVPLEDCLVDEDPIQVMFVGSVARMRAALAIVRSVNCSPPFGLAHTEYEHRDLSILDVISSHASKGAALAEWARRRGIARDEIMALGDNWNDRDMLEFAGLPIVMGNSVAELQSLGWPVTLSNDEGGVAAAIRKYVLDIQETSSK
ncbi:MAG: Cof-type HAD-IIB family hydrolase [Candidatus Acidiferrales bacterium]